MSQLIERVSHVEGREANANLPTWEQANARSNGPAQKPICSACQRSPMGRCLSHTTLPFGQYGAHEEEVVTWELGPNYKPIKTVKKVHVTAKTFDEVPLGYLDWMAGEPTLKTERIPAVAWIAMTLTGQDRGRRLVRRDGNWVEVEHYIELYGWLKKRLIAYLTRPVIAKELDDLFPDPDDDTRQPAFLPNTKPVPDKWHAQPIRRDPEQNPLLKSWQIGQNPLTTLDPEDQPMTAVRAWAVIADSIITLESMTDPNDWLELDIPLIKRATEFMLGATSHWTNYRAVQELRNAYRTCRLRLQDLPAEPSREVHTDGQGHHHIEDVYDAYFNNAQDSQPCQRKASNGKRRKAIKIRRRRLNHTNAIVSIERAR